MAYIRKRKNSYSVVYRVKNADGIEHQKSESYATQKEAEKRKKEIEYKQSLGTFVVPKCTRVKELVREYVRIYGHNEWGVSTYDGNIGLINNYILPTIGETPLSEINNHFMEKYYASLLKMPAVKSTRNMDGDKMITAATVHQIHKVLRSCFRQAVKWEMMDKNPAIDATLPKYKAEEREIWTAEMLMQAIDACENKWLKVAFHLAFAATVRIGELLGLTWDCVDVSEEAIAENRAYIFINKQVERVSRNAVDEQGLPDVVFHSLRHTSVTYKLKLSGGDIKAVQGDSGHAQADMVTEVYGHIIDEDRRKNAQRMEDAFYNRENLNPQMKGADAGQTANTVAVPEGVDADLLMKVLGNPEMAALLTSLAKSLKAE